MDRPCVWLLARKSGDVHLREVPRLEHDGGDPVGGGLVTQRDEDLPSALALQLRIKKWNDIVREETNDQLRYIP